MKLILKRRRRAFLGAITDSQGKPVFVHYENGSLIFRHSNARALLATVDVRLTFQAAMMPMFAVNGFGVIQTGAVSEHTAVTHV